MKIHRCPICDAAEQTILKGYERDHLVKCASCSFVFSNINPSQSELDAVYKKYTRGMSDCTEITLEKYKKKAKLLQSLCIAKTVLDVGCGDGHFLDAFRVSGARTYGTEFDAASAAFASKKGTIMLEGGLLPVLPAELNGVDLIIFTEVIEHINNPKDVLAGLFKLLNPGGLIFITTPNFGSIERYLMGPSWGMITYPEHISYYTSKTLDLVLARVGFRKVEKYSENISPYRIAQFFIARKRRKYSTVVGSVAEASESFSRRAQWFANRIIFGRMLYRVLNIFLGATNSGSSLIAIYRRPAK